MQGIEQNPKLGYYKVGEEIFYSKPQAYIRATELGFTPKWVFNPREFAQFDWSHEPESDLRELYRLRALQLREKYDYIRLECSGGGDSTTAAFAFLLNGIHLDEVVFRYPKQLDKDVVYDPFNTLPENTLGEWEYAAKPLLHWIKTNYPNTKVTFYDYSENLLNEPYMQDESWVFATRDWFQPGHGVKFGNFGTTEHRNLAETGQSICVIYGVDKPRVALIDNEWYVVFVDVHANNPNPIIGDYTNITTELFFWTPDMPEIVAKQAHMIRQWFDMPHNQQFKHITMFPSGANKRHRTTYENMVKSIIYHDYDQRTWQTAKPTNSFYNEMDHWFHINMKDTNIYSAWTSGLKFIVDKVDRNFLITEAGQPVGLVINHSPFYYLGPSTGNTIIPKVENHDVYKNLQAHIDGNQEFIICKNKKIQKIII